MTKPLTTGFLQTVRTSIARQHSAPPVRPTLRTGSVPLSFNQERLWQLDQSQPGNPAHNLRAIWRLTGPLNVVAFAQSLNEIVRRHEILRTTFPAVAGQPVQCIAPTLTLPLPVADLLGMPAEQQAAEVEHVAKAAAQQPFSLAEGPLLRVKLLQMGAEEFIFLRTIHHLITDAWSDTVFLRELATLYPAFSAGDPSPLPPLAVQYADFAQCQREWLQGARWAAQLAYWQQQLQAPHPLLHLPTDYAPATWLTYQGAACYGALPASLIEQLQHWSQQAGVSLFVILLAAFKCLLYQYARQTEITVCSPVAGRSQVETKQMIGYFNQMVFLRTDLSQNPTFLDVVARLSRVTIDAFAHQDVPLDRLATALNLPGFLLSRAMFAFQNVPSAPVQWGAVTLERLDREEGISNFDLSLALRKQGGTLLTIMRYKSELFARDTITQMLTHYQALLEKVAANPQFHLDDLPLLGAPVPSILAGPVVPLPPASPHLEQIITQIWQEVLQLEQIDRQANFFELGGRSLGMAQVHQKIQAQSLRAIPLMALFQTPTIAGMVHYLDQPAAAAGEETRQLQTQVQTRAQKQQAALRQRRQGKE